MSENKKYVIINKIFSNNKFMSVNSPQNREQNESLEILDRNKLIKKIQEKTNKEVYKTTDIWLNLFRLNHEDIFDKIGWLDIKKHHILAQEIINNPQVREDEITWLISDPNIDSNIRMELFLQLHQAGLPFDMELLNSLKGNLLNVWESSDWVIHIKSDAYVYSLLVFRNYSMQKWYLNDTKEDPEAKWEFIYSFDWWINIKSSWERI